MKKGAGRSIKVAQCLALCLGDPGKFSMGFSVVFQASTGKKLRGKNHGKNIRTQRFDVKHSTIVFCNYGSINAVF